MRKNRFLAVGLVLSLSFLFGGSVQAQEPPAESSDPEPIPTARDPWEILQTTPGVLVDRISVSGSEGGCGGGQPLLVLNWEDVTQGFPTAGEAFSAARDATGPSSASLGLSASREIHVSLGGSDLILEMPGVRIRPYHPRGTNQWQASGLFEGSGGGLSADRSVDGLDGNRLEALRTGNAWVGGPLSQDRLWIWGEAGLRQVDRTVLGGQEEERSSESSRFKLNAQIGSSVSTVLLGSRTGSDGSGIGAGPGRAPETTWEEDGREAVWGAEATPIFTSNFYLTAGLSREDRRLGDLPRSAGGGARIGLDGVARGSWFDLREEQRTRQARLETSLYPTTGPVSHEILLGAALREQDEDRALSLPGPLVVAGRVVDHEDDLAMAEIWRTGQADARTEALGLWAQDRVEILKWTALAGLRADRQDLGIDGGSRPWTLAPRLGLSRIVHSRDREHRTLLWASLGRFASRLGSRAAWHLDPDAPAVLRALFEDRDGDLSLDPGELVQPLPGEGIDPLRPGLDPDAVDSRLRPEITDEAVFSVEREMTDDFWIGLRATWRRTRHVHEERLLVRDLATGEVFVATSGDWIPTGRLTGALPDGTPYEASVWDLRPGLLWTGGTLLTNGDRQQDDRGLSLTWKKQLANRWMSQGHVTWQDGDRRLGSAFRRFDDPTNTLGGGDDEGLPVTGTASWHPHETPRFQAARWSFNAVGMVLLPYNFNLSAAVNGRQGDPLPYYRQVARERAGLARVQLTGRPDALRTDDLVTVDTGLEKEMFFGDLSLAISLEALNLLNEGTVLAQELDLGVGRDGFADETLAPRTLKVGVRMSWR